VPGRIRQEDIDTVRERADIVQVIQQYLQLKRSGRDSFLGLCPFHTEKTSSLSVSQDKQLYYCFGCGAAGNVYHFLMAVENVSFPEAVERLAKQVGVTLRYEGLTERDRKAFSRKQSLHKANGEAAALYHRHLVDAADATQARAYLAKRRISKQAAEDYGIGLAPSQPDFLLRRLAGRFSPEILVEAGLVVKDARGELRDRFRGRLTFPIHDLTGQPVGFGARLLAGEGPKYVNSPETPVYRKGELLYNLHRAKAGIAKTGRAILVEGYTDVIALGQGGIEVAVATCGTALSDGHFRLLARFAERAVLAFDSDQAGARAAARAFEFHEQHAVEPVVLVLPEGLDPADLVATRGAQAFEELAEGAVPLIEFMIGRTLAERPIESVEDRARAVRAAVPIVAGLQDPVRREQYASLLADRAGVQVESVLLELDRAAGPETPGERPAAARVAPNRKVEREALKLLVREQALSAPLDRLTPDHFQTALYRKAWELLRERGTDVATLMGEATDEKLGKVLASLAVEPLEVARPTREYVEGVALRLEEFFLTRRIVTLRKRLEPLNPTTDPPAYDALFSELLALEGARRRVRAAAAEESAGSVLTPEEPAQPVTPVTPGQKPGNIVGPAPESAGDAPPGSAPAESVSATEGTGQ